MQTTDEVVEELQRLVESIRQGRTTCVAVTTMTQCEAPDCSQPHPAVVLWSEGGEIAGLLLAIQLAHTLVVDRIRSAVQLGGIPRSH